MNKSFWYHADGDRWAVGHDDKILALCRTQETARALTISMTIAYSRETIHDRYGFDPQALINRCETQ